MKKEQKDFDKLMLHCDYMILVFAIFSGIINTINFLISENRYMIAVTAMLIVYCAFSIQNSLKCIYLAKRKQK